MYTRVKDVNNMHLEHTIQTMTPLTHKITLYNTEVCKGNPHAKNKFYLLH